MQLFTIKTLNLRTPLCDFFLGCPPPLHPHLRSLSPASLHPSLTDLLSDPQVSQVIGISGRSSLLIPLLCSSLNNCSCSGLTSQAAFSDRSSSATHIMLSLTTVCYFSSEQSPFSDLTLFMCVFVVYSPRLDVQSSRTGPVTVLFMAFLCLAHG